MSLSYDELSTPRILFSVLGEDKVWEVCDAVVVECAVDDSQEFATCSDDCFGHS